MILFKEDWDKYPDAIVHNTTRNKSFLRFAALLKYMGVENHAFCLALHNPALEHVDPHDPNLSPEIIGMVAEEAHNNFWYHIREIALVPPPAGNDRIPFKANRANMAFFWLFFNHITSYLIQIRQTGKSLSMNELTGWLLDIGTLNSDISILTKDDKLRNKTSVDIREIINLYPNYLQILSKADIKNSERITVKALKNVLNIYVGRTDKKAADNTGRGMTTPIVEIDEFGYIPNIHITLPVILTASVAAREVAASSGVPYGTFFATTPGKLNTESGKYAYSVYNSSLRWSEKFYDAQNQQALNDIVAKNTRGNGLNIVLLEFNHNQLGYTDEWLRERISAALSDGESVESDFLMKWVGGGSNSPISKDMLQIIKSSLMKTPRVEISDHGYTIEWYVSDEYLKKVMREGFIVIGADTSDAVGQDGISLNFRSSITGEVLGSGNYNETNLTMFSDFLANTLITYENSVLIMERRSSGAAIIDNLITILHARGVNPFKRLFNWIYNDADIWMSKVPELFSKYLPDISVINKYRKHIGFGTSGGGRTSRSNLYGNIFNSSIKYTAKETRSAILIGQLTSLVIKNGRIDHLPGEHDDAVIAWLLAYWFLISGNNKKYYGINDSNILSTVVNNELINTGKEDEIKKIKEQEEIKTKIEKLISLLKRENNEFIALKILNKIKMLENKLDYKIITNFNLDNLLQDIKIMKRLEKKQKHTRY